MDGRTSRTATPPPAPLPASGEGDSSTGGARETARLERAAERLERAAERAEAAEERIARRLKQLERVWPIMAAAVDDADAQRAERVVQERAAAQLAKRLGG